MRRMKNFRIAVFAASMALAGAAHAQQAEQTSGADQVVGLFGATCLHFANDTAGLRAFLSQQGAPQMPATARDAFLAGRQGQVFDVSYQGTKLALVTLDDGTCEAVTEQADAPQVLAVMGQAAHEDNLTLTPLGPPTTPKGKTGVQQNAYSINLAGKTMHVLVSTASVAPQAVLTLVPR